VSYVYLEKPNEMVCTKKEGNSYLMVYHFVFL